MTPSSMVNAAGRLAGNPGFLAARFSSLAATVSNRALAPFGLRARAYSLLELAASSGGLSQRDIGQILCLDKAHVVRLVDQVTAMGLVVRTKDPTDGRSWLIRVTPEGASVAEDSARALEDAYDRMLGSLTPDERTVAISTLQHLAFGLTSSDE